MRELKELYKERERKIKKRLSEFERFRDKPFKELFPELCFCLLTPGTSAERADAAVTELLNEGLLFIGNKRRIKNILKGRVRFHNNKARYVLQAQQLKGVQLNREWLVKNVKGFGWKEASHFLRNVGLGEGIAIIDRHILKNLKEYGILGDMPKNLSKKNYLLLERKMKEFSRKVGIPLEELDLLLWSKETGKVFK